MITVLLALHMVAAAQHADPFAFFQPEVTITADDRSQLDRGLPIAHVLPSKDLDVAVVAIVPVHIDPDRLVAWVRRIELLKKSRYVLTIQRFSDPPCVDDLKALALDDDELKGMVECQPGDCGMKLSAAEMAQFRRVPIDSGGVWKQTLQDRFRAGVLGRVAAYRAGRAVAPYVDHRDQIDPLREFAGLVDRTPFLAARLPAFAAYLRGAPGSPHPGVESFLYWSKERIANKAIISVTHVNVLRGDEPGLPEVLVVGKQISATHYLNASMGITALMRGEPGGPNYLVYVNRSELDVLRGMFGPIIRHFIQSRLKGEAAAVLDGLRERLESGDPPRTTPEP